MLELLDFFFFSICCRRLTDLSVVDALDSKVVLKAIIYLCMLSIYSVIRVGRTASM